MIAVQCECGKKFKVAEQYGGKRAKCPACGAKLRIPSADAGYLADVERPDEGFEGVAALLEEAPSPARPATVQSPLTAIHEPPPRKKKQAKSGSAAGLLAKLSEHMVSIIVIGLMIAVTLGAVWGGGVAYQRFRFGQALGGGDPQAALREVTADLPYAVSYANDIGGDLDATIRRRLQMLTKVLASLPEGTDLAPLLELKPNAMPYSGAFGLVQKRATLDWIIEHSCNSSADGRKFAAELLRRTFPFGLLEDAGFEQLVEATSVSEKRARYDKLYASLHKPYEDKLVGHYRLQFDVAWKSAGAAAPEGQTALSPQPRLSVACRDYVWTIDLYGMKWTGKIDELQQFSLACPTTKMGEDLSSLPHSQTLARSQLRLTFQDELLAVAIQPLPAYAPASSGRAAIPEGPVSRYGVGSTVPAGAVTKTVTTYVNGAKVSEALEWTLPEQPGYAKFDIRLVRDIVPPRSPR